MKRDYYTYRDVAYKFRDPIPDCPFKKKSTARWILEHYKGQTIEEPLVFLELSELRAKDRTTTKWARFKRYRPWFIICGALRMVPAINPDKIVKLQVQALMEQRKTEL